MNTIRTAVVTAAAVGVALASSVPASAAPVAPKFLSASQWPASLSPWSADPVRQGLPDSGSACTAGTTPAASSSYRDFRTELDTGARQTTTVASTTAEAKRLAAALRAAVEGCLERLRAEQPGLEGETRSHGTVDVEEGAHVYSIDTSYPEVGSTDIALYAVGRDGRTVTVLEWGQLGDLDGAPLQGFKRTTGVAVAKLR
ncbi:hypothetical protein [Streptomyces griseus]|uniref:hypothetical protein n=1 Tax=Streptomyces griseus TaxID=1911 RepID=UPI0008401991|nr:hypothetical protein [Streptomyces griseus]